MIEAERKAAEIFRVAPWLMTDGKCIHIPVSGMDERHQLTWPDLKALLDEIVRLSGLHIEAESALLTWDEDRDSIYWRNHPDRIPDDDQ